MRLDHLLSKEHPLEESGKSGQQTRKCLKVVKKRRRYCLILRFLGTGISKDESGSLKPKRLLREELETKGNERKRVRIWKEGKNPAAAKKWGCSSAGRAPALHAGGQEFDPPHLHQGFEVGKRKRRGSKNMGS